MSQFFDKIPVDEGMRILDVGGFPATWTPFPPTKAELDIVNIDDMECDEATRLEYKIRMFKVDGCAMPFKDREYDVVFSNSVVEHLGTWEKQQAFASEVRRVGRNLWIQTPAAECFFEPHYLTPFIHWLRPSLRIRVARYLTLWGWIERPSRDQIEDRVKEIRLLSFEEMNELFPDCEIVKERFLGLLIKSYIAVRTSGDE